jgi:hypothetical protein
MPLKSRPSGRELGAVAVEVTKALQWDQLTGWLGEDMLVRRIAEVFSAVADDGMEISEEEHAVLNLAGDYATGNRPQTSWVRLARKHQVAETTTPLVEDDEGIDSADEVSVLNPSHTDPGSERNDGSHSLRLCPNLASGHHPCECISRGDEAVS